MKYRHEIDGLRAVAVIPVILFHAGFTAFSGGYIGVDVFFVISGYLITTILIEEIDGGRFSLRRFYERRARRILPALFFVMSACIPFAWLWMLPVQFEDFTESLMAMSLFSSNILFWFESGYFALASEEKPLLHTWSLAVEEQYYLLFPLFLMISWRLGIKRVFVIIAVIAFLSLLLSNWGAMYTPRANFFLAPSRAWELLAGSICALLLYDMGQKSNNLLSLTGLGLILFSVLFYDADTPFPSYYALAPVGGTAFIILFGARTWVAKLLSTRIFVGIGLISYSTYLWHQPLFAFTRLRNTYEPEGYVFAILAVASLGLGYLSWRYIEVPFRQRNGKFFLTGRRILVASFSCVAAMFALGVFSYYTDGRQAIWAASARPETLQVQQLIRHARRSFKALPQDDGACRFNAEILDSEIEKRIRSCYRAFGQGVAILGDSHAHDLFGAIISNSDQDFIIGVTKGSCRPFKRVPNCQYDNFNAFVSANPDVFRLTVFQQAGRSLLLKKDGTLAGFTPFSRYRIEDKVPEFLADRRRISLSYEYLRSLAHHTNVVWLGPRIEPHIPYQFMLRAGCDFPYTIRRNQEKAFIVLERAIETEFRRRGAPKRLIFKSQIDLLQFDWGQDFMTCNALYWSDSDHWGAAGEKRFGARLLPILEQ